MLAVSCMNLKIDPKLNSLVHLVFSLLAQTQFLNFKFFTALPCCFNILFCLFYLLLSSFLSLMYNFLNVYIIGFSFIPCGRSYMNLNLVITFILPSTVKQLVFADADV